MPFSFTEIASIGDVLPNNRHALYFPTLPNGVAGKTLTLRHTTVTLPPWDVAQVVAKLYGWSVAFPGRRSQENLVTVEFVETTDAPVVKTLVSWQSMCSGFKNPTAKRKSEIAVKSKLIAADTTGKTALTCSLFGMWPKTVRIAEFAEETGAMHISAEFSVDAIDLIGISEYTAQLSGNLGFSPPDTIPLTYSPPSAINGQVLNKTPDTKQAALNANAFVLGNVFSNERDIQSLLSSFF